MNIETKFYRENEIDNNLTLQMLDLSYSGEKIYENSDKNIDNYYKCLLEIFDMALQNNPKSFLAVTYCENVPVNMVLVSNATDEKYIFEYVATNSNYRKKGMAYITEKNCIKKIKEQGGKTIQAYIFYKNINSIELHKKIGFEKVVKATSNGNNNSGEYEINFKNDIIKDEALAI